MHFKLFKSMAFPWCSMFYALFPIFLQKTREIFPSVVNYLYDRSLFPEIFVKKFWSLLKTPLSLTLLLLFIIFSIIIILRRNSSFHFSLYYIIFGNVSFALSIIILNSFKISFSLLFSFCAFFCIFCHLPLLLFV